MSKAEEIRTAILERLSTVIDPETGVDVIRMRLIEDLVVEDDGRVSYKFRPSSPICPIAIPLSQAIQNTVAGVQDVKEQDVEIVGFLLAEELSAWLQQAFSGQYFEKGKDNE